MAQYPSARSAQVREQALSDTDPLVRTTAARTATPATPGALRKLFMPLVSDPIRTVRTAAALRLLEVPPPLFTDEERTVLAGALESQRLLVPEPVDFASSEAAAVLDNRELLGQLGLEVETLGGETVLVSAYPAMLANFSPSDVLRSLATQLSNRY